MLRASMVQAVTLRDAFRHVVPAYGGVVVAGLIAHLLFVAPFWLAGVAAVRWL